MAKTPRHPGGRLKRDPTRVLKGQALLPGLVNAHSHAFQRGLRGLGERFPTGAGSFWSWREAMYGLVEQLGPEDFLAVTTQAFLEMRAAGITTVGEFHYFHHGPAVRDFGYDRLVLKAARAARIRWSCWLPIIDPAGSASRWVTASAASRPSHPRSTGKTSTLCCRS
jgi:cytosine/adenosine deaminase-related metal-dependent hydrolase